MDVSISILLLVQVATLTAQQAHLVYDKHFVDPPQSHLNENHAPHSPPGQHRLPGSSGGLGPQIAMFPPGQAPPQYHHRHKPHRHGHFHMAKSPQSIPHGPVAMALNPTKFASRRGPLDNIIKGAKQYFPGSSKKRSHSSRPGTPIRFMEMNRLPKPPKYPLYDMPDMGMVTPPPPPLMHPMASGTNMITSYTLPNQPPQRGGRAPPRGKKPQGRRGGGPPQRRRPSNSRQGPPPSSGGGGGHRSRRPTHHGKHQQGNNPNHSQHPYDQGTSSSNFDTQTANSPPLGRPLNYDEYMKRPSHSFTDDPWNFDPYAANYNSGMNTFAMKYNYDPLDDLTSLRDVGTCAVI